jgi:L-fuconolactonase
MLKIDAHQHFWKFDVERDSWITDEMKAIRKDFLPADIEPYLKANNFDGCVTVQAVQSEEENIFQLENAAKYDFIKGIVGWVDLQKDTIDERLAYYKQFKKIKGFRHVLQGEVQRDLMVQPLFIKGIGALQKFNYTYDILIFPDQLRFAKQFVAQFPNQKFVIDHLAKPGIKDKKIEEWKRDIMQFAPFENVHCKISGYITEADLNNWTNEDFLPFFDVVINTFGTGRIIYGSDWPVSLLGGTYNDVLKVVTDYFASFTTAEQDNFFGKNAINFYDL